MSETTGRLLHKAASRLAHFSSSDALQCDSTILAERLTGQLFDIDVLASTRGMLEPIKAHSGTAGLRFINYKGEPLVC